jgi:hypothetical protein
MYSEISEWDMILKATLSTDQLKFTVHWSGDGSHQIHEDCRGHW